jgi:hypothetical protein
VRLAICNAYKGNERFYSSRSSYFDDYAKTAEALITTLRNLISNLNICVSGDSQTGVAGLSKVSVFI